MNEIIFQQFAVYTGAVSVLFLVDTSIKQKKINRMQVQFIRSVPKIK